MENKSTHDIKLRPFQWKRKLLHLFNGSLGLWFYIYSGLSERNVLFILASCAFISFLFDVLRMKWHAFNEAMNSCFSGIMRNEESHSYTSNTKGLSVTLLVLLIFPRPVNILVMIFSTYGDTAGGIVGGRWGKIRLNSHATLEGTLAVWLVSALFSYAALRWIFMFTPMSHFALVTFLFLAGSVAAIAEGAFPKFDDNLTIPLFSAPVVWCLLKVYGMI